MTIFERGINDPPQTEAETIADDAYNLLKKKQDAGIIKGFIIVIESDDANGAVLDFAQSTSNKMRIEAAIAMLEDVVSG